MDCRSTPGMELTSSVRPSPSSTNTGRIRSSAVSTVSRIRRRLKSSRRMRRMRVMEKERLNIRESSFTIDSF